jgi:ribonuclease J
MMDIHASGHGSEEEVKKMIKLLKPKYLMPIHGFFSKLTHHGRLAESIGMKEENIVIAGKGNIVNVNKTKIELDKKTVPANHVLVDGLGVGDVGEIVLRDRQNLAEDGMFVVIVAVDHKTGKVKGSPDIISRGFIYLRESKDLLRQVRRRTTDIVGKAGNSQGAVNWSNVREDLKSKIGDFLFTKTKRKPIVIPVIIEV